MFISPKSGSAEASNQTTNDHDANLRESDIRQSTLERRTTWIGEGLIDLGGLDAVDRLSDIRSYEELVKRAHGIDSGAASAAPPVKSANHPEEEKSEFSGSTDAAPRTTERRRSKLLDFLANDVGERYLDDVYQDEERDAADHDDGSEGLVSDSDLAPAAVATEKVQSRESRANSKLLAFLAQERGDDMLGDDNSTGRRNSMSSSASSASGSERNNKLLNFVTKVVPEKPRMMIFNPSEVGADELHQIVAEEAQKKKKKREDKEKARQKVMAFLAEEESKNGEEVEPATIKSVDEASVRRETVVDQYGTVELLDFHDRTDRRRQKQIHRVIKTDVNVPSSSASDASFSSPSSAGSRSNTSSSPRSLTSSIELENLKHVPVVASSSPSHTRLERAGNRLSSFLNRVPQQPPLETHSRATTTSSAPTKLDQLKRVLPPSMPGRHGSNASTSSNGSSSSHEIHHHHRVGSARMTTLLASLDQITQSCQKSELSDVSIARISTLLASVNHIIRDDLAKNHGEPNRVVRRLSTSSWLKSGQDKAAAEGAQKASSPTAGTTNKPEVAQASKQQDVAKTAAAETAAEVVEHVKVQAAPGVLNSFKAFEGAQDLVETLATFNKLLTDCGLNGVKVDEPWRVYNHIKAAVADKLGFRQKQLFKLLDTKFMTDVYKRKPCAHKRVCVIGAGPVGMRAAVELALLGAQVVVLEKRKHFTRENILHLWPWVVQDLTALGAKVFFPQFCHSTAYFHVGTRQLQCILLKIALVLGVTVYSSTSFDSIARPDSPETGRKPFFTVVTKPQIPWMEFTSVLGAAGTQDKLSEQAGINRFIFSRKEAIGLVCYFPNLGTTEEKKVTEFSWTVQFKQQKFAQMREIGIDLENIVYYRGEMHYIVMTPKRQNLLEQGVCKVNYPQVTDLVGDENMDKEVLHEYVKRVVNFLQIPKKAEFTRVKTFDFSTRTRADKAASILSSKGKKLYVGMIGDSLLEPFWPEGVGTCRGFLGALDGVWMIAQIGRISDEQLLADRELAYRIIQHVSGFRRDDLQKNVRKYNVDPKSRYTVKFPQLC